MHEPLLLPLPSCSPALLSSVLPIAALALHVLQATASDSRHPPTAVCAALVAHVGLPLVEGRRLMKDQTADETTVGLIIHGGDILQCAGGVLAGL